MLLVIWTGESFTELHYIIAEGLAPPSVYIFVDTLVPPLNKNTYFHLVKVTVPLLQPWSTSFCSTLSLA